MKVLVIGDSVGALTAIRELGQSGWQVGLGSEQRHDLAAFSRHVSRWHCVPRPGTDIQSFLRAVNAAIRECQYEVLLGTGDAEVLALSRFREQLTAQVPYSAHENVERSFDKFALHSLACKIGIGSPQTALATEPALAQFQYPLVVKARLHWSPDADRQRVKEAIAQNRDEALAAMQRIRAAGAEPILQQFVAGMPLHFVALCDRQSNIVQRTNHLTTVLGASASGQSARAEIVPVDPQLARQVAALLAEVNWFGLADLQFWVRDDGDPLLTDFNGRIYGGLALPHAAGYRMIADWASLATERPLPVRGEQRTRCRYQSLEGDLRRSFRLHTGQAVQETARTMAHSFQACHPVWNCRDPMPACAYLGKLGRRMLTKLKKWLLSCAGSRGTD